MNVGVDNCNLIHLDVFVRNSLKFGHDFFDTRTIKYKENFQLENAVSIKNKNCPQNLWLKKIELVLYSSEFLPHSNFLHILSTSIHVCIIEKCPNFIFKLKTNDQME